MGRTLVNFEVVAFGLPEPADPRSPWRAAFARAAVRRRIILSVVRTRLKARARFCQQCHALAVLARCQWRSARFITAFACASSRSSSAFSAASFSARIAAITSAKLASFAAKLSSRMTADSRRTDLTRESAASAASASYAASAASCTLRSSARRAFSACLQIKHGKRCAKAPGAAFPLSATQRHTAPSVEAAAPNQGRPRELCCRHTVSPQHAALTHGRRGPFGAAAPFPLRRRAAPHAAPRRLAPPSRRDPGRPALSSGLHDLLSGVEKLGEASTPGSPEGVAQCQRCAREGPQGRQRQSQRARFHACNVG